MSLLEALWDAAAGFFRSAEADRGHYQRHHPERPVYAPKITRRHVPWPGADQQPTRPPRPHRSWPGGDGR